LVARQKFRLAHAESQHQAGTAGLPLHAAATIPAPQRLALGAARLEE
jgi:hypothetical protein